MGENTSSRQARNDVRSTKYEQGNGEGSAASHDLAGVSSAPSTPGPLDVSVIGGKSTMHVPNTKNEGHTGTGMGRERGLVKASYSGRDKVVRG